MRIVSILRTLVAIAAIAASPFVISGCQLAPELEPTPPDLESAEDLAEDIIEVGGSNVLAISIPKVEYTQITVLGVFTADGVTPLSVAVGLRLGLPIETGCSSMIVTTATPAFEAHQRAVLNPGTYCLEVFDPGTLTENVSVLVRVVHPAPIAMAQPGTVTASSVITVGGRATRSFEATVPGSAAITLTDLQPSVETGLGIGLQLPNGAGCRVLRTMTVRPRSTPHFTAAFDPGSYCVEVFDIGNYTGNTTYSLRIDHP
jgi:hypothetical protein